MSSPKIYQVANLQSSLSDRVLKAGDTMTGNLNVAATLITQNVIPNANVTYDLGTSTARFKDLWLSNSTIYLGEASISAQGGNVSFGNAEIQLSNVSTKLNVTNDLFVSGNVGIGTASPSAKLSVDGSVVFNESGADVDFRIEGDNDANLFFVDASTDRIGVGTNTPATLLDVVGTVMADGLTVDGSSVLSVDNSSIPTILELRNDDKTDDNGLRLDFNSLDTSDNDNVFGRIEVEIKNHATEKSNMNFSIRNDSGNLTKLFVLDKDEKIIMNGRVGIGTSSPAEQLSVVNSSGRVSIFLASGGTNQGYISYFNSSQTLSLGNADPTGTGVNGGQQLNITNQGNVGIGTTSPDTKLHLLGGNLRVSGTTGSGSFIDIVPSNTGTEGLSIGVSYYGTGNYGPLKFSVGGSERARITAAGGFLVGQTAENTNVVGHGFFADGFAFHTRDGGQVLAINRQTDDGTLVSFRQANIEEGSISVSGATVSYNAFAGSHWSQLQDGSKPDILRGTVMESINELCVWEGEENERLPKCKISDTAGSKKVYGVFMAWDNDWTETNDMYVTAVGAFVCRVNAGVTVQEGDLLESNGDGTARVQADDIIRSSTIGKVTSTVKTHEYDDGSYCVPTVLYCG